MKEASSHTSSSLTGNLKPITFLSEKQNRQKTSDLEVKTFHRAKAFDSHLSVFELLTFQCFISSLGEGRTGNSLSLDLSAMTLGCLYSVRKSGGGTDADHQNILNSLKGNTVSISSKKAVRTHHE